MIEFSFLGKSWQTERVIGDLTGNADGPTIVFVGGIHGNEPSGVIAIHQVFGELKQHQTEISGRLIGLVGNLAALSQNRRFVANDLNRAWNEDFSKRFNANVSDMFTDADADCQVETQEQFELFSIIEPLLKQRDDDQSARYFIDLHTTSAPSAPFIAINDQLDNRKFALQFPLPTILGIEEYISGALLSYLNDFGHVAVAFEAGQHTDPEAIELHRAFIYQTLIVSGQLTPEQIPNWDSLCQKLESCGKPNQGIYEVIHRHSVTSADAFRMKSGFQNFMPIRKDEVLAEDMAGQISAPMNGMIFMPLYQDTGEDGFFVVRPVPRWAMKLSAILRNINFDSVLTLLPGISRSKSQNDALVVNKRIARWLATDLFHLLGYRRKQAQGDRMIFSRREISR